jgi:hypothetical protein
MITPRYEDNYWLNQKANNLELKKIMDYLTGFDNDTYQVKALLDPNKRVYLLMQKPNVSINISFGENFPQVGPTIIPQWQCHTTRMLFGIIQETYPSHLYYILTASSKQLSARKPDKQQNQNK